MKSSLIALAVPVAVVGVVSVASAPSRSAAAPAAKQSCSFATLPRSTLAGQQSLYGHISSLTRRGNRYVLRFDPAWLLSGVTASRAALEDTGSADVPNDTYTRDETHKLLTYLVPASAHVTVLTHPTCSTRTTVAKLASSTTPRRRFWISVRIDTVRSSGLSPVTGAVHRRAGVGADPERTTARVGRDAPRPDAHGHRDGAARTGF